MRVRLVVPLVLAVIAVPAHAEPAVSAGVQVGAVVPDPAEPVPVSWFVTPQLAVWPVREVGIELGLGVSRARVAGDGAASEMLTPTLSVLADPVPEGVRAPVRPLIRVGGGLRWWRLGEGAGGDSRTDGLFIAGAGVAIPVLGEAMRVRTELTALVTAGARDTVWNAPSLGWTWTAGLEIKLGAGKDRDNDDVPDRLDQCPDTPEDLDGFQDEDGCPDPDDDGDGVLDALDDCDLDPEDLDGFEDYDGCPDPDNDGDGILDVDDVCPDEAGPASTAGCPDTDGDGIPDAADACPEEPGVPASGCPPEPVGVEDDAGVPSSDAPERAE